jgi:hypothetical protein
MIRWWIERWDEQETPEVLGLVRGGVGLVLLADLWWAWRLDLVVPLMAADGKLIVQTDKGELVVAKATEKAFEEISRAQVLSGRCWTTPVLVDGRLYVRNAAGAVKCLNLKKKG